MIPNLNPEEKDWWDREMDSYLQKRVASPRKAALIIFAFVGLIAGIATCDGVGAPKELPQHDRIDTGWLEKHGAKCCDTIRIEVATAKMPADSACPLGETYYPQESSWDCVIMEGCWTDSLHRASEKWQRDSCAAHGYYRSDRYKAFEAFLKAKRRDSL